MSTYTAALEAVADRAAAVEARLPDHPTAEEARNHLAGVAALALVLAECCRTVPPADLADEGFLICETVRMLREVHDAEQAALPIEEGAA